jgi:phytoene dehydrogenase-like protein
VTPARKYYKTEPSSSALVFYWGVQGEYPQLKMHNVIFSDDYKKEFTEIFDDGKVPNDPTIYIYISSKYNPTDAVENGENWFVMINMPPGKEKSELDIESVKKKIIEKVKKTLNIDLNKKIIFERILTPQMIEEKTSSVFGSLYGISSNNRFAAFLRQDNRSKEYNGLYFCGGSAHPGGGIPLVILSGKIVSDLISKYGV